MRGILTYHSIDGSRSPISISAADFARHADWLASGAVRVVPLAELVERPGDDHAVAITFDDAYENLASLAWPLLRERGLPATVFVPTGRVGRDNAWGEQAARGIPTLPLCEWPALARMAEEGLEIGSHTVNHALLDGMDARLVRAELSISAETIEARIGRRPRAFCYPYGVWDDQAARIAGELYDLAVTTELRALRTTDARHRLPRLDAYYYRSNRLLESWGSDAFRRHLWLRARLRRLRAAL
jgi:peptidoglycan/xylan/chitin deacetylase (PgdA/CDA1 family)